MCASQKALLLLAVVVCGMNGQFRGLSVFVSGQPTGSGNTFGNIGLPGGNFRTATGAFSGSDSSFGFSGIGFDSSNPTSGTPVRFGTSNTANRGPPVGSSASSSGFLSGSGVTSSNIFGGSRADDSGNAAAFNSISGSTTGPVSFSSRSFARGGRRPSPPSPSSSPPSSSSSSSSPPPSPSCSSIRFCVTCVNDSNGPSGIRCTSCPATRILSANGFSCDARNCSPISNCLQCIQNALFPSGLQCTLCNPPTTLQNGGRFCFQNGVGRRLMS